MSRRAATACMRMHRDVSYLRSGACEAMVRMAASVSKGKWSRTSRVSRDGEEPLRSASVAAAACASASTVLAPSRGSPARRSASTPAQVKVQACMRPCCASERARGGRREGRNPVMLVVGCGFYTRCDSLWFLFWLVVASDITLVTRVSTINEARQDEDACAYVWTCRHTQYLGR